MKETLIGQYCSLYYTFAKLYIKLGFSSPYTSLLCFTFFSPIHSSKKKLEFSIWKQKHGEKKLSLSHASVLTAPVTQSGLETNASSRMMTHHPAWQTQNAAVPASGQWSCCLGAGSVFVPLWLSRLRDNSADNSWGRRLSLSHQESWFPPSAWSHGLPRAFLLPPQEHSLGHGSRSHGNSLWG